MKLYLDENLTPSIAEGLRERGVDVTSAHEVGNVGLDDRAQLAYATREGRAIVSADLVDLVLLARDAVAAGARHAGIILVPAAFPSNDVGAAVASLEQLVKRYPAGAADVVLVLSRSA